MFVQYGIYLILISVGIMFSTNQGKIISTMGIVTLPSLYTAHATPSKVYPPEYAYRYDSVTRTESPSANCRRYPPGNLTTQKIITTVMAHN